MFILSEQRDKDVSGAFSRYADYLEENRDLFPKSAYQLAVSDWYFDFETSGCPHDSWLDNISISETSSGERHEIRSALIKIELLAAYHNGKIVLEYPDVYSYQIESNGLIRGHDDWRYDEFRISDDAHLVHEIAWCGASSSGRWLIEASDVKYSWHPFEPDVPHTNQPNR